MSKGPSGSGAGLVRRALAGHAAIGLLAGALIYLISLTGTLVVIHDRWERWEQPDAAEMATLSPAAAQAAMVAAVAAGGKPRPGQLYFRLPNADLPRASVTVDGATRLIDARGRLADRKRSGWTDFVITLHETLTVPGAWGEIAVGAVGVMLAAATMTGIVAHPRIVRDAFRLRLRQDPQLARADWHNRLGTWTLPFALAIALTGAFFGLGNLTFAALAKAYHGGDVAAAYASLYGGESPADAASAPLPDVASALANARRHAPQAIPTYVIVHAPATRGQFIEIIAEHPRRLIYGESYRFDVMGRWQGAAGLADGPIGRQVAASTYGLHFGNYGGLAVEVAYVLFGFALCAITATGMTLWLEKRRRRGLRSDRLVAYWRIVVWGTPITLVVAAWLDRIAGDKLPTTTVFWSLLASSLIIAVAWPDLFTKKRIRSVLAAALLTTGTTHLVYWQDARIPVAAIDVVLIMAPFIAMVTMRSISRPTINS